MDSRFGPLKRASALALSAGAFALALWAPGVASAAPGAFDTSFGADGSATLTSGTELDAVGVQPDGSVVAAGDNGSSIVVARFSPSGVLESTFSPSAGVAKGLVVQPDGKIVIAGYDSNTALVERLSADGRSLDGGFAGGGIFRALPGGRANAVALGPGGTIVAAGRLVGSDQFQRIAVIRLHADGSPDNGLAPGGVAGVDLGQDSVAKGVAVQGDGRIVLAGSIGPGTHEVINAFVARVTATGGLDPSFNNGGVLLKYPQDGGAAVSFNAVALDPAGGILVAGANVAARNTEAIVTRLTCGGTPDPGFGGGFELQPSSNIPLGDLLGANGVVPGPGSRLVAAGEYQSSGSPYGTLWGLEPNGSTDFSTQAPTNAANTAVTVDSAGNFVVSGNVTFAGLPPTGYVARYLGYGAPASGSAACGGGSIPSGPAPQAPGVLTGAASAVTATTAKLSGSVNPNGQATTYHFDYGTTGLYGSHTTGAPAGAGSGSLGVAATISHLKPSRLYHYRLVASSSAGTTYGADRTFRTAAIPSLSKAHQSHTSWAETASATHHTVGTVFSFKLNETSTVLFSFTQQVSGRKVHGRCVAPTTHNRHSPSCRRTVTVATLSFTGHAGTNTLAFAGGLSHNRKLKPGHYTLVITATSGAARSKPLSLSFTIVG